MIPWQSVLFPGGFWALVEFVSRSTSFDSRGSTLLGVLCYVDPTGLTTSGVIVGGLPCWKEGSFVLDRRGVALG